ncbi:MAG TPA: hypothetical protein VKV80_18320 [Streptosporangiaceae bacterium]|nr:hypothetical protein [Streptosporangiaceae bacterium]
MVRSTALDHDALADTLRRQHDVISREQALACGMTCSALWHRVRPGGRWHTILPGVYLSSGGTPTAGQRDMAALLHAGPGSVITGASALLRHGIQVPHRQALAEIAGNTLRAGTG